MDAGTPDRSGFGQAAVAAILLALAAAQFGAFRDAPEWRAVTGRLYGVAVVLGFLGAGWKTGVVTTAVAALLLLYGAAVHGLSPDATANLCLLFAVSGVAGVYVRRAEREQARLRDIASRLSEGYASLQVNFEAMKRAERLSAIGHLSAGLAHEIRNPLASIAGAASILRRTESKDGKVLRCIDIIESECRRLNGLLTNFLNFARPRSPHFQKTDVSRLLAEVMELAEHAGNRRQIQLQMDAGADLTDVECDPEQLRQVLLNLLINAIEASADGSRVTLSAGLEEDCMTICVVDEGSGVTPEDIDKLFDPFFTTKETGTGLGLPVAHQIIGQMGGNLTARRNPGRGMTFSVILPLTRHGAV